MSLTPGTRLGAYEITVKIGQGGMGEVYRARDPRLERDVAVKVVSLRAEDTRGRARLEREARAASKLSHPNVVTIHDVGRSGDLSYFVMEHIDGHTLRDLMTESPVPLRQALNLAVQVADGLTVAHSHELVHRDLKPENIMVTSGDLVKILDFGIAKQTDALAPADGHTTGSTGLTGTGDVVGTLMYMSPEQARGETLDQRSDQFSMGLLIYELVTGRHPFARSTTAETIAAILRDDPEPTSQWNPDVPAPLQWILERCLSKTRDARYESTGDLARDLRALRDRLDQPIDAQPSVPSSNVPVSRTPLIGREREVARGRELLKQPEVRLVTFTGPGGTGKTRLAVQVATELEGFFDGHVYFVPLASISDPGLVPATIAQTLGLLQNVGRRQPLDLLKETLGDMSCLLLLDNFEQLLEATPLLVELLESCSQLRLLITSRAVLRLYGEHELAVPPLAVPARDQSLTAEELSRTPAVALFVQRATAARPDFVLTADNGPAVAEICSRLDGLPLAIELAAARIRMLTPVAMLSRMKSRFQLLTGGARDLPGRQRTLRATVEWSHDLLTTEEQKLFRRLAVFVNGGTLEAVEAVCNALEDLDVDVLDGVESLAGQSLVQRVEHPGGEDRFVMFETIREYARERLESSDDASVTAQAHAAYCLVLAEEGGGELAPAERLTWLQRCDAENDNYRAALDWAARENPEWAYRIAAALFPFWEARELLTEGAERVRELLALPNSQDVPDNLRAGVLNVAGNLFTAAADVTQARGHAEEALRICRASGDLAGVIAILNNLAVIVRNQGDPAGARALFEECLRLSEESGSDVAVGRSLSNLAHIVKVQGHRAEARTLYERALAVFDKIGDLDSTAWSLSHLGDVACEEGDAELARGLYEKSLLAFRRAEDPRGVATSLVDLGLLAGSQGNHEAARASFEQALTLFRELGHRRGIARVLDGFAISAAAEARPQRALRLAGAASAIRHTLGFSLMPTDESRLEHGLKPARQALGASDAATAGMEGWSMPIEQAIEYARSGRD